MNNLFKLKQNNTTVKTEIIAGLTTFMTMAYIIALNPNLLTNFGAEGKDLWNAVFLATCIASAIGMFVMAFAANKPFAMAPGMGLNSFFAIVVTNIVAITVKHVIIIVLTLDDNPSIPSVKFIAFVVASITKIANGIYNHIGIVTYLLANSIYVSVPIFKPHTKYDTNAIDIINNPNIFNFGFKPSVFFNTNFL